MSRKTEKAGKFRNVNCSTWNMAIKLKIMENEKHSIDALKMRKSLKNVKNEQCIAGPGIWRENGKSQKMRIILFR